MSVRLHGMISRLIGTALIGSLLFVAGPKAEAQVTLNLTTAQQANCTVTTDAQGIRLAPGGTNLIATGVTLQGTGCGIQGVAPTPNPFTITPNPTGGQEGTTFQLAWSVTNATSCTGTASLDGSSTSVPGWTDVTSTTSPRTVTLSTAGTYQFGLTCSNASGSASGSTSVVVTVGGGSGNCPAGRQTTAQICYQNLTLCASRDMTQFAQLFGYSAPGNGTPTPFPGLDGLSLTIKDASKTAGAYFASQFTMPTNLSPTEYGFIQKGQTYGNHSITFSISPNCGDFSNTTVPNPNVCLYAEAPQGDWNGVSWKSPSNSSVACPLTPGQTYYLNYKFTTPPTDTGTGSNCNATTCNMPLKNAVVPQ